MIIYFTLLLAPVFICVSRSSGSVLCLCGKMLCERPGLSRSSLTSTRVCWTWTGTAASQRTSLRFRILFLCKWVYAGLHPTDLWLICVFFPQWALEGNARALEAHPCNLSKQDDGGAAPLHYASSKGHVRVINLIVQIAGSQGQIPVHSWPPSSLLLHVLAKIMLASAWRLEELHHLQCRPQERDLPRMHCDWVQLSFQQEKKPSCFWNVFNKS